MSIPTPRRCHELLHAPRRYYDRMRIFVEALISMHLHGSTHFYASPWKHSFLCISMEALISMHLHGSTHSYTSPWKHSFLCIFVEALILIHLRGSTHSYTSPTSPKMSCYTSTSPVLHGVTKCRRAEIH